MKSAAGAFAEALRGRDLLGQSKDARVEARLKEVEKTLVSKGVKKQQIIDALNALGPIGAVAASSHHCTGICFPGGWHTNVAAVAKYKQCCLASWFNSAKHCSAT